MGAILKQTVQILIDSLFGGGGGGGVTRDDLVSFTNWVASCFEGIGFDFEQEQGAVKYVTQRYGDIHDQMTHAHVAIQGTLDHVVFTIIPNSLGYLEHNIYVGWIQPIGVNIAQLKAQTKDLYARLGEVWTEVYNSLRPDVNGLLEFEDAFKKGDQPSINQLIAWLRDPVSFGEYMAPLVALPLANYINTPVAEPVHKGWAYVMTNVWDDEANAIWDTVARWLVSDT